MVQAVRYRVDRFLMVLGSEEHDGQVEVLTLNCQRIYSTSEIEKSFGI